MTKIVNQSQMLLTKNLTKETHFLLTYVVLHISNQTSQISIQWLPFFKSFFAGDGLFFVWIVFAELKSPVISFHHYSVPIDMRDRVYWFSTEYLYASIISVSAY